MKEGASALLCFLRAIEGRPGLYIGNAGIDGLFQCLGGWKAHRHFFSDDDAWAELFFQEFHGFVASRSGEGLELSWQQIIKSRNLTSPSEELEVFFHYLGEFVQALDG